jgi:outer membrane immunogenic protein
MKKAFLASSALFLAAPALGADLTLPVKAPIASRVAPIPYSWTACYLGGHGGYGTGRAEFADPTGANFAPPGSTVTPKPSGGIFGGQVGCDYQFDPNWVVGIEGDWAWANLKDTVTDPFFSRKAGPNSLFAKNDEISSVTGRVGYSWDRVLFYGKGGAVWAHDKYSVTLAPTGIGPVFPPPTTFNASDTRFGGTVGGGIEWAFLGNWSARAEFDYYNFGSHTLTLSSAAGTAIPANIKQQFATITLGINYRFGTIHP